jgi:hypothetical protein
MKRKMTTPQKISLRLGFFMTIVVFTIFPTIQHIQYQRTYGPIQFYDKWRKDFVQITKPEQDKKFAVKINSKEWYTMRLNCVCSSKEEFDALIIKDSNGHIYTYDKHVCGYEGFLAMNLTNVSNLKELQHNLLQAGFKLDL